MSEQNTPIVKPQSTKAYSKAEKLRRKRGRPRMQDVEREPNGRRSRRKLATQSRIEKHGQDMQSVVLEARIRHGVPRDLAHLPQAGTALGRITLMFPGRLGTAHIEAGERMGLDYARYYALSGIPFPSVRAANLFRVHGTTTHYDDPARVQKAVKRVMDIEKVLGLNDIAGRPITRLTKQVCIMDDDSQMRFEHMVKFLRRGLEALAAFYGLNRIPPRL